MIQMFLIYIYYYPKPLVTFRRAENTKKTVLIEDIRLSAPVTMVTCGDIPSGFAYLRPKWRYIFARALGELPGSFFLSTDSELMDGIWTEYPSVSIYRVQQLTYRDGIPGTPGLAFAFDSVDCRHRRS